MNYDKMGKVLRKTLPLPAFSSSLATSLALVVALGLALPVRAQQVQTGTLKGRVLDAASGRYVGKVQVSVADKNITTYTDDFGDFVLENVPAGRVTVTATYAGDVPITTQTEVVAGKTTQQDLTFNAQKTDKDGTIVLSEFLVESHRFKNAQQLATSEERFAPTIKNVVAADAFGDIPSGNVGEMVKFIPGVQIEYGNFQNAQFGNAQRDASRVSVRGFDEADTAITIDGMPVASATPGSLTRTVGLDMLSINNASRVEVIKVATPDMPNNSIGGQINLITKSAFEYRKINTTVRVFTQLSSEDTITLKRTGGPGNGYSYKTQPSFDASVVIPFSQKLGITFTGSRIYEYGAQTRIQPLWFYTGRASGTNTTTGAVASANVPGLITNSAGVGLSYANPYFARVQLTDTPQETDKYSGNMKIDWKPNDKNTFSANFQYSSYNGTESARRLDYRIGAGSNAGLSSNTVSSTSQVGGGNRNNATGVVTFNNTPLDWGPTFTISRPAGTITPGTTAAMEVLNAFDKVGTTDSEALSWKFRASGWAIDVMGSRSTSRANFETTKNGHFSGASATMKNLGTMKFLDIRDGMTHDVQIFDKNEQRIDTTQLSAWTPDTLVARFGDSKSKETVSVYKADVRKELDFIPWRVFAHSAVKVGVRRDEQLLKKWGLGTSGAADLSPTASLTTNDIFSQIVDTRTVRSPGYDLPSQQWLDAYKLYELDQKYHLFQETAKNKVDNYNSYVSQQKDLKETKDAIYAMVDGSWFNNRLSFVGGLRQEETTRVGRTNKTFNNAQFVMYDNGTRYIDSTYRTGVDVLSASSPLYAQTPEGTTLRAKLDSLKISYPTTPLLNTANDNLAYAQRRNRALQPVNAKVKNDPSYTAAFSYDITKKISAKVSYSRSFGLIDIEAASNGVLTASNGYTIVDYDSSVVGEGKSGVEQPDGYTVDGYYGTVQIANPFLKPWISDNIDLQLSYYTDAGGKFAVTYFAKSVTNQVANLFIPPENEAYLAILNDVGLTKPYQLKTAINLPGKQKTHGYEFEARQNLENLGMWGWGKAFTVFGSFTLNSLEPVPVIPPQTVVTSTGTTTVSATVAGIKQKARKFASFGMFFEKGRVNATVKGVYRERNEIEIGSSVIPDTGGARYHRYEPAEVRIDLSLNVRITKVFSFFSAVRDISMHKKEIETYDDKGLVPSYTYISDRRSYGAVISAGIRGEF